MRLAVLVAVALPLWAGDGSMAEYNAAWKLEKDGKRAEAIAGPAPYFPARKDSERKAYWHFRVSPIKVCFASPSQTVLPIERLWLCVFSEDF